MLIGLQRRILFPHHAVQPLADGGRSVSWLERWAISVPGGEVEAYFIPGDGVSSERPGPLAVFAHGNGELIDYWTTELQPYWRLGVSVLLPEYRGYGRSAGEPSEKTVVSDALSFVERALARDEVDADRLIFHGRSLGGGVVCSLGRTSQPAGYILESTFTSVRAMARRFLFPGSLIADPFDSVPVIARFAGPVLIFHGTQDRVVPISHGRELMAAHTGATFVERQCGHNDMPHDDRYWNEVGALVDAARPSNLALADPSRTSRTSETSSSRWCTRKAIPITRWLSG